MSSIAERMAARQQQAGGPGALEVLLQSSGTVVNANAVKNIAVQELHSFAQHTFKIREGSPELEALIQSVREKGIVQPIVVRSRSTGGYEIIAGHTRCYAAKKIGLQEVPAIIHECSDDEAIELMAETNKQRESWLPSERIKTYSLWWRTVQKRQGQAIIHECSDDEAIELMAETNKQRESWLPSERIKTYSLWWRTVQKRQGQRTDLLLEVDEKDMWSRESAGQYWGITGRAFQMYLKMDSLVPELLSKVDGARIALAAAYELAFLNEAEQRSVAEYLSRFPQKKLNKADGAALRQLYEGKRPMEPSCEWAEQCLAQKKPSKDGINVTLNERFNRTDIKARAVKKALADDEVMEEIWTIIEKWVERTYG